jgi:mono/diheme cytochrome c family protein
MSTNNVRLLAALLAAGAYNLTACRQDMHDQPRLKPFKGSSVFADGTSARLPPSGTVAHDAELDNALLTSGSVGGQTATTYPFPVTEDVLRRGQDQFQVFCEPCHGRIGEGDGAVARRGFFPRPVANLQDVRLRYAAEGYIFGVITNGFSTMPAYGPVMPPSDRWAVIAYLRALQFSQHAAPDDVPEEERAKAEGKGESP